MPQVTGAVTWETNVAKRQTSQKKPVVVDNSLTRIENHHMEARMRIRVRLTRHHIHNYNTIMYITIIYYQQDTTATFRVVLVCFYVVRCVYF